MDLHQAIKNGDLEMVRAALAGGVDPDLPGHCGRTPLMTAISQRNLTCFHLLLEAGADPERSDDFNATALHAAVSEDVAPAVQALLARGVDTGRSPRYPLKRVHHDFGSLIGETPMPESMAGIMTAEQWQELNRESLAKLADRDPQPQPVIEEVRSIEVLNLLLAAGEDLKAAPKEIRRRVIGLLEQQPLTVTVDEFSRDRRRRFGTANPERIQAPFWEDMIRSGGNADTARTHFGDQDLSQPIWCHDRFGQSLTRLADGRFVGIAGEHEDSYDPDFEIYSDVIVHDGSGGIAIHGYPRECFPPTDFHSATLVGDAILIIGNLGYPDDRRPGTTSVYRLDLTTFAITRLETRGTPPGWISRHQARFDAATRTIALSGGVCWSEDRAGVLDLRPFTGSATLALDTLTWMVVKS